MIFDARSIRHRPKNTRTEMADDPEAPTIPWRVLLIESDEDDYVLIRELLARSHRLSTSLEWASTYEEGMLKLLKGKFDAAVVDYYLLMHNGLELVYGALAKGCHTPFIILTDREYTRVRLQAHPEASITYLAKSELDTDLLQASLKAIIQHEPSQN